MKSSSRRCFLRLVQIAVVVVAPFVLARSVGAQALPSESSVDNGTHWYGSYDGVHENVSLSSGNVSFCIPLVSLKGPNKHDLTVPLCYNSQFQEMYTAGGGTELLGVSDVLAYFPWVWAPNTPSGDTTPPMGPGWSLVGAPVDYASPSTSANGYQVEFMPDGARYSFPMSGGIGPDGQNADTWLASTSVGPLIMKDGTRYTLSSGSNCPPMGCAAETFPDTPGASINWTNSSVTDLVGRTVTESSGSTFSGSSKTSSTAYINFQYPDSSGTMRTVSVQMSTMQFSCSNSPGGVVANEVGSGFMSVGLNEAGTQQMGPYSMPTAIVLPDGLTYTFQYDACGMLRKVTYPSGGYTRYDFSAQPLEYGCNGTGNSCGQLYYTDEIAAKHVCPSAAMTLGATSASLYSSSNQCPVAEQTTTYAPTAYNSSIGSANSQNVVTDPLGNYTVYQFSPPNTIAFPAIPAVETSRQYYDASGKLWKTVTTQYSNSTAPGSTYQTGGSITTYQMSTVPALPTIQTTTLDNGMVSQIQWSYNLWSLTNDSVLTEERVYDYGSGAPGALLKTTDYDWLHRDNPSYYGWPTAGVAGAHICDRKTSEIVHDGSGKLIAQTTYVYDNNSPATYGTKGLLTSVRTWRSTDGAWLTTNYQYGAYGNVTQKTDPSGNVTQYSYADNYADGVNRNSYVFLTQTTYPATANGVSHITQSQYYWGSGLVAATCGENFSGTCKTGLTSGADYASYTYDLMGRKISATTGDGGQTTNSFSEMTGQPYPLQVTSTETIASGVNKTSAVILDGEARTVQSELLSDPSCSGGTVNVVTTYDMDGRKSTVTNPYCSTNTGAPTSGTTTYSYDGLSRVTQVTHPDGTYAANTYTGRAVLSSDEGNGNPNGNGRIQRISQTDALGRLIYVCEVTGQTQQGNSNNTPSSCGLDLSGSGFLTTYGYDASGSNGPLESLTNVTQGGVNRTFVYDSLGELKSATNPESGTTTYNYDNDGNLTGKTDALGKTTTYSYDSLNRLTGKSYSDGTASACFQYDAAVRGVGRLAAEWTQYGTCSTTPPSSGALTERTFASYDLLGRVATDEQCATPGNCGSSANTLNYSYDLAGDVSTFNNGLTGSSALSFTNQYNSAGRLSTVTDSGNNIGLFTAATANGYTPAGALMNATIGSEISFHRDYNNRLLPIDETDTVATTPGSAAVQIEGAEQFSAFSIGSVTFSGAEQCSGGICDSGTFLVTIGPGQPVIGRATIEVNYGQNDTPLTLASYLASMISCSNNGVMATVQATSNGEMVNFASCSPGTNTDYSIVALGDGHNSSFAEYSFAVTASGAAMTPALTAINLLGTAGSSNPNANSVTFYGTEQGGQTGQWVMFVWPGTVNGGAPVKTVVVSWGSTSTPNSLASAMAASFSACSVQGTVVTATANGPTVTLSSCNGATYALSGELNNDSGGLCAYFSATTNGSTPTWQNLNVPAPTFDSGSVTLTVNGTQVASTTFGKGSTPSSIVSGLVSAGANNTLVNLAASASNSSELQMTAIGGGSGSNYSYQLTVAYQTSVFAAPSFAASPASGTLTGGTNVPLYNWAISSYAPDGDVLAMTDYVMGSWTYTYDDMNRLTSATATAGVDNGLTLGWTYDRYGNRWAQNATGSGNASAVQPQLTFYGNTNRIDNWSYDAAGNLLYDNINHYTYDAENRIATLNGAPAYIYDAEGRRVAKTNSSGAATIYVLGLGGEQVSELNGSGAWVHSNVFAGGGRLLASYEGPAGTASAGYHFHLTDWLGSKRMQTTAAGNQEEVCYSYPFGDGLTCTGAADATEHHFTGKERDVESGLDYFGARYLTSDLGRFMTPDWAAAPTAVPYANDSDPQSLNLYTYVHNNPMTGMDEDGHCGGLSNCNPDWWNPPFGPNSGPAQGWDGNMGQPPGGNAIDNGSPFVGMNWGSEMTEGAARIEALWHSSPSPPDQQPHDQPTFSIVASDGNLELINANGSTVADFAYSTGLNGDKNPADKGKGPIPPGTYTIDPKEISHTNFFREHVDWRDWGDYRVPLHPALGTKTYGRSGFFMHGGTLRYGSEGCIKVHDLKQDRLFQMLTKSGGPVTVTVR